MFLALYLVQHCNLIIHQPIICCPAGNSPWPIGVTSIGIHDRTSREKISHVMNGAAHVMNDEATRKYLQVSASTCRAGPAGLAGHPDSRLVTAKT